MISINNISVEFSARPLFQNVGFVINETDKIALTGKNGAGKSTLLKLLAGLQTPDTGSISKPDGLTIGYLPQQMELPDDTSVRDEVKKAFKSRTDQQEQLERLDRELAERTDYESDSYHQLIDRIATLREHIDMSAEGNMEADIERTLLGLGFERTDFDRPTSHFSGGWRMRIELAKILLARPSLLLLDEPTNHLDIESITWLENFLQTKAKAVVLVSHDRAFIDNVTRRTIEINCGRIYDYKVNYSKFLELREERVAQQRRAYDNQQKEIAEIKDFIERFRYKPTKSNQVQSRIKQLAKIVPIEIDQVDNSRLRLKFPPAPRSGDFPLIAENVGKAYGDHQVFDHADLTLRRGDKVAFVGRNGEGKSTMVKCIMDEIPFTGRLQLGHNVKIGYFAQNQAQLLDGELTVFDTIDHVATGDMRTRVRDILGAFMFGGEASDKKVKVLSGGEKTRLAMIRLLLEPVNFLILDEPTNHLDITSKEVLKDAIRAFDGTVIIVSHDRYFLDGLVDRVYEFGHGRVRENLGGIYDFLRSKEQAAPSPALPKAEPPKKEEPSAPSPAVLSYKEQRERDKMLKRAKKEIENAEAKVAELEGQQHALEERMAAGDGSQEVLTAYADCQKQLENAMSVWELAQIQLEELQQRFS